MSTQDGRAEDTQNQSCKVPEEENLLSKTSELFPKAYADTPKLQDLTEDTTCGIWCIKGEFLQRFANRNAFTFFYGILGCVAASSYSYLNGIITTLEKRFKIPSTNTGIIMTGSDVTILTVGVLLNYYGGRGHRPRWIAFGIFTSVGFCLMNALCHFLYGPGEDALLLTKEFGGDYNSNNTDLLIDAENRKLLCQRDRINEDCEAGVGNLAPQIILFMAHFISGIGGSLYYTLGVSYMDDNTSRSKSPILVSISYFMRMLGPVIGYAMASVCLNMFISPTLTPTINKRDPRWLGAWWIGWLVLAAVLSIFACIIALFPKSLPQPPTQRMVTEENVEAVKKIPDVKKAEMPTSIKDMLTAFRRLLKNRILMCNNAASIFFLMGFMPFWIFMPKYFEVVFRQSASRSSFITGVITLACGGVGILGSGFLISKIKPSARALAAWNIVIGLISVGSITTYAFLGCSLSDNQAAMINSRQMETTPCNQDCHCNFVKYSPVCSPDGRTFISPCHAGCNDYRTLTNGSKVYSDCSCVPRPLFNLTHEDVPDLQDPDDSWVIREGLCPVDCGNQLLIFLTVMSFSHLAGSTGRTSNFLLTLRCVDDSDKTIAMALGLMLVTVFAFIPSPILFGHIIDTTCLVWGKTCTGTGNCWIYDAEKFRYYVNFTALGFISMGCVFDVGLWYYVKGLKIFEDEDESEKPTKEITS
ncbi:solute carrier organic anion transporter family member 74D-like [Homalodisca vitripennis]|uniref:solute carrier organic anion transporter family member 74D-like n=1 Tax=Homalodisca vitripennis TaxID=197043 RepID=UPI001EEC1D82|nr:solute carrier organic anion transporter family member 74D-like [Homalodisca vitripennis]